MRRGEMPHGDTVDLDCSRCGGSGEYCGSCGNKGDRCNELGICEKFDARPCPCVQSGRVVHGLNAIVYDAGDLETLRVDVGLWAERNFGNTLPDIGESGRQIYGMLRCTAGMSEELAELIESSDQLTVCPQDIDEALDAIADICIYSLDFLHTARITMQTVLLYDREPSRWEKEFVKAAATIDTEEISELVDSNPDAPVCIIHVGLTVLIGKIHHSVLKQTQQIRRKEDHMEQILMNMCHVWRLLYRLSAHWKNDLNELVKNTATHVLKRDWTKNQDDAHEVDSANR